MAGAAPVVVGRGLTFEHRSGSGVVRALDAVDVDVLPGMITALVGPTGSGKSTLLRLVAGITRASAGTLVVAGRSLTAGARGRRAHRLTAVGHVEQEPSDNVVAHLDARAHLRLVSVARGVEGDIQAALDAVRLGDRADVPAGRLSGGEQQRLAVAMACLGGPPLVLGDEPTAELDRESAGIVVDVLSAASREGAAVVVCSHDPELVAAAGAVVRLDHGRVVGAR